MDVPRRNLELKAHDPDPAASLAGARALGARDEGILCQRDTYFAAPSGRLKLREQEPGGAQLITYERADDPAARESRYRLVDVPDPEALRAALDAALGTTVVVRKRRHLLLSDNVRIHLDDVDGLGAFVELEAVVPAGGDPADEAARVQALRDALGLEDDRLEPRGYASLLREGGAAGAGAARGPTAGVDERARPDEPLSRGPAADIAADTPDRTALVDAARTAMGRAHAPFSGFAVGAALRDEHGTVHAGANVENSAYPQGQCAEASALGVLVAAGGTAVREVAVMADADLVTPCGGCRQRLADFATTATPVHLCGPEGVRRTVTLGELLPLSFGAGELPA